MLPEVAHAIRTAKPFEELRYVYYWRVIAEWYARTYPSYGNGLKVRQRRAVSVTHMMVMMMMPV